jgi:ribosome recycling factor
MHVTADSIIRDAEERMKRSIEALKTELARIRTGRAHPSLLDHIKVDFYGTETPLSQAAQISISDPRTLSVTPWDKAMVSVIDKAIRESDLGLNPATAGLVIRVPLPPLSEERRKELIKVTRGEGEQARVAIRNVRRDAIQHLKQMVKDKSLSEDEERRAEERTQKFTDAHIAKVDEILAVKEKELLEI